MRRRLVFVTQQVDPEHPLLAPAVAKIRALAERVDEVVVLTSRAVPGALPENCRVRLFDARKRRIDVPRSKLNLGKMPGDGCSGAIKAERNVMRKCLGVKSAGAGIIAAS